MSDILLSNAELNRYSRHLLLKEIGVEGQVRLKQTSVLVVGAGGLGAPLLLYLAAAGIGTIGIVDNDVVDASNLQRQVLFTTNDIGRPKVEAAQERLLALNPEIEIVPYQKRLTAKNAESILQPYSIVADGTDNFPTRYLVNDACVLMGKTNVYASIFRFEGQVSVFNFKHADGTRGPNYRDVFPEPPPAGQIPSCADAGVLGVLPGLLGTMQANEVIKVAAGIGTPLVGKLFVMDALTLESHTMNFEANPSNPLTGDNPSQTTLIDYEQFCSSQPTVSTISYEELVRWQAEGKDHQLVDVREPQEHEQFNIGGTLVPLQNLTAHLHLLSVEIPIVLYCRSGARSAQAAQSLIAAGYASVFNLEGGIQSLEVQQKRR